MALLLDGWGETKQHTVPQGPSIAPTAIELENMAHILYQRQETPNGGSFINKFSICISKLDILRLFCSS